MEIKDLIGTEFEFEGDTYRVLEAKMQDSKTSITLTTKKLETKPKNKLGTRSEKSLIGVDTRMQRLMREAVKDCPVDFTITDGVRNADQQHKLWCNSRRDRAECKKYSGLTGEWRTNADGRNVKSNHQPNSKTGLGMAVDLYPFKNGKVDVNDDESTIKVIAPHIKKIAKQMGIKIEWGGDWSIKNRDYPHFQIVD